MKQPNKYIGFDDKWIALLLIPISSLLIPLIFFGRRFDRVPFYTKEVFVTTLIMTAVIWLGNRAIMIWARKKYTSFAQTRKRLWMQSSAMFVFTIIATNGLHFLLKDYCGLATPSDNQLAISDLIFKGNAASLMCTLTAIAIYEGIYFMKQLRHSIEEAESLKRESLKAQLDALKTQVNPHFLFNNLNTLTSLIPENPKHAIDFVQQLSKVYRHILDVKDEKSILLQEELEVLKAYAFLLKTRFGDNLSVTISIPNEKMKKRIVPLSLQLLMENAIKHNIVSANKPLQINIFSDNGSIVVDNNLQMKKQISESTGIGLDNIRNRYKLLSDKVVKVIESETNFTVSIPLIEN
jgi:two-component system, LytTR family, sensor kinase